MKRIALLAQALLVCALTAGAYGSDQAPARQDLAELSTTELMKLFSDDPFNGQVCLALRAEQHRDEAKRLLLAPYRKEGASDARKGTALRWLSQALGDYSQDILIEAAKSESAMVNTWSYAVVKKLQKAQFIMEKCRVFGIFGIQEMAGY